MAVQICLRKFVYCVSQMAEIECITLEVAGSNPVTGNIERINTIKIEIGDYVTRDGRKARVICIDAEDRDYPVVALVKNDTGVEHPHTFTIEGKYSDNDMHCAIDLIKTRREPVYVQGWLNVYNDGHSFHNTKMNANKYPRSDRIACVFVSGTEEKANMNIDDLKDFYKDSIAANRLYHDEMKAAHPNDLMASEVLASNLDIKFTLDLGAQEVKTLVRLGKEQNKSSQEVAREIISDALLDK